MKSGLPSWERQLITGGKRIGLITACFIAALLFVGGLTDLPPVYSLFQSPVRQAESPVETPVPADTPLPQPVAPADTQQTQATTPTVTVQPAPATPLQPITATIQQAPLPTAIPPTPILPAPVIPTQPAPVAPPATQPDSPVVINQVTLIDTFLSWIAWIWMFIGVGVILLILMIIPLLQIRGAHLNRKRGK